MPSGHTHPVAKPIAEQPAGLRDDHRILGAVLDLGEQPQLPPVVFQLKKTSFDERRATACLHERHRDRRLGRKQALALKQRMGKALGERTRRDGGCRGRPARDEL